MFEPCPHTQNPIAWTEYSLIFKYEMPTSQINKLMLKIDGYATMRVFQMECRRCVKCGQRYRVKANQYEKKLNADEVIQLEAARKAKRETRKILKQTLQSVQTIRKNINQLNETSSTNLSPEQINQLEGILKTNRKIRKRTKQTFQALSTIRQSANVLSELKGPGSNPK